MMEWLQYGNVHVAHFNHFTLEVHEGEVDGRPFFSWAATDHLKRNPHGLEVATGAEMTLEEAKKECEEGINEILMT